MFKKLYLFGLLAIFAIGLAACPEKDEEQIDYGPPVFGRFVEWPNEGPAPPLSDPIFTQIDRLAPMSNYFGYFDYATDVAEARLLPSFGIGNGKMFAIAGLTLPFSTLHDIIGPTYQKKDRYFSDVRFEYLIGGVQAECSHEWIARTLGSAVITTIAECGDATFYTITFAPIAGGLADGLKPTIQRVLIAENNGDTPIDAGFRACSAAAPEAITTTTDVIFEKMDDRILAVTGRDALVDNEGCLAWPAAEIGADDSERFEAYLATASNQEDIEISIAALNRVEQLNLLTATLVEWEYFNGLGLQLSTSDIKTGMLLEALRYTIRVQQTDRGSVSPMSLYTSTWTRDTMGPVRFYLAAGLHDQARKMMDYHYNAILSSGDYFNAYDNDRVFTDLSEPDWSAKGKGSGRTRAEGPSYVPLMYWDYFLWTGDLDLIGQRYGTIKRGVDIQVVDENGLLKFSDDETFRVAMAMAMGRPLEGYYRDSAFSANSSFLFVRAAEIVAEFARLLGKTEDAAAYSDLASKVREATEQYYWLAKGRYAPCIDEPSMKPEDRPFEDVNTKPLWTGYLTADDPKAAQNVVSMIDEIWREDGLFQSEIDGPSSFGDIFSFGVHTGMTPGYGLDNLARLDHPFAEGAFNALDLVADAAGTFGEYMIYDDHSALQFIYSERGSPGDYTARFRPWEGGINGAAMVLYLLGLEPDAAGHTLTVSPHLPNGWTFLRAEQILIGENFIDVELTTEGDTYTFTVTNGGPAAYDVTLILPIGENLVRSVTDESGAPIRYSKIAPNSFGMRKAVVKSRPVGSKETLVFKIRVGLKK